HDDFLGPATALGADDVRAVGRHAFGAELPVVPAQTDKLVPHGGSLIQDPVEGVRFSPLAPEAGARGERTELPQLSGGGTSGQGPPFPDCVSPPGRSSVITVDAPGRRGPLFHRMDTGSETSTVRPRPTTPGGGCRGRAARVIASSCHRTGRSRS